MPRLMKALAPLLLLVCVGCLMAPAVQAATPCYAAVLYVDKPYGRTAYEYKCGGFRLHAGQRVKVPVKRYGSAFVTMTTAVVVRITSYRTYYGGPLRTVAGVR